MTGVETGALDLGYGFGGDSAGFHKGQGFADTVRRFLIFLRPWRASHIIMGPCMHLLQIGIAPVGERPQQVQRRCRLAIGADHTRRIGRPTFSIEFNVVDYVPEIAW